MPSDNLQELLNALQALTQRVAALERLEYGAPSITTGTLTDFDRLAFTATVNIGGTDYAGVPISHSLDPWKMVIGATVYVQDFSPAAIPGSLLTEVWSATPPWNPLDPLSGHRHNAGIDQGPIL